MPGCLHPGRGNGKQGTSGQDGESSRTLLESKEAVKMLYVPRV
jgi:ribosomal protein L15